MSSSSVIESPPGAPSRGGRHGSTVSVPVGRNTKAGPSGAPRPAPEPQTTAFSSADAAELAARRAAEAKLEARLRGWKPLTLWYAFWAIVIAIGSISSLGAGHVGSFFIGVALSAACVKYTHYLYNGGRRRVWFFIW